MSGGDTAENSAALEESLKDFPNAKSQTRDQFVDNQIAPLKKILNILYVLLALSVFVSFFGIINTLVLTVFERTRELGMLRAVGMTRRQVRRMIRHESVITALIGGVLGLVLGIVLGGAADRADRLHRVRRPVDAARGLRDRSGRRRHPRRDLPCAPRRAARPARGAAVRVAGSSAPAGSPKWTSRSATWGRGTGSRTSPRRWRPACAPSSFGASRRPACRGSRRSASSTPSASRRWRAPRRSSSRPGTCGAELSGLVLNERGWERLAATTLDRVNVTLAATEEFNLRNGNATLAEATERVERILGVADRPATATISVAFGCPFEGEVDRAVVPTWRSGSLRPEPVRSSSRTRSASRRRGRLRALVERCLTRRAVGGHFHDTRTRRGQRRGRRSRPGATVLDASVGGLGGCPFAPRATGNVATEDVLYLLERERVETGVDLDALIGVARWLEELLGRELPGRVYRAGTGLACSRRSSTPSPARTGATWSSSSSR